MRTPLVIAVCLLLAGCGEQASVPPTGGGSAPSQAQAIAASRRLDQLEQALASRDQRIRELERDVHAADARFEDLAAAIDGLRKKQGGEMQSVEQEIARMGGRVDELQRVLDALRRSSLVPNVERDVPKIDGRVIQVERGANGVLVLLDVGGKQGVKPTFEFTVARAGKAIARVVVDQVEAEVAGARVVSQKDGEQVQEGDAATTRP